MSHDHEFKIGKRMAFVSGDEQDTPDDRLVVETNKLIANSGGRLSYSRAHEMALAANPKLAKEWLESAPV